MMPEVDLEANIVGDKGKFDELEICGQYWRRILQSHLSNLELPCPTIVVSLMTALAKETVAEIVALEPDQERWQACYDSHAF